MWFREAEVGSLVARASHEPDPARRLALAATWITRQLEVGASVSAIVDEAARADSRMADMRDALRLVSEQNLRAVLEPIASRFTNAVTVDAASELIWALSRPAVYTELVARSGWSPRRYEAWLAATLQQHLLGSAVAPLGIAMASGAPGASATDSEVTPDVGFQH